MPELQDPLLGVDTEGDRAEAIRRALLRGQTIPPQLQALIPGAQTPIPPPVPSSPVASPPVLGPSQTTPGGMTITPVGNPGTVPARPGDSGPLAALQEQMGVINQLVGRAPQMPALQHTLLPESVAFDRNGFRHVSGGGIGVDPASAAQMAAYQTESSGRDASIRTLLDRLGTIGSQALQGGHLGLQAAQFFGAPGAPGQAALTQSQIESAGIPRQQDAQNAAAYQRFVEQRIANGGSIEDASNEWVQAGHRLPGYAQPPGTPPAGVPPVPTADQQAGQAIGTPPPPPPGRPQTVASRLNQAYQTIQRRQSGVGPSQGANARIVDTNSGITDFVHSLGENFINDNTPEVMRFITDRFGGPATDAWFTNRSSVLGPATPQEEAIRIIQRAANRRVPGIVGSSGVNRQTPLLPRLNPFAYD